MKPRAAVHLRGISIFEFICKAKFVQSQLQDPLFTNITPSPAEVVPLLNKLQAYCNESDKRNFTNIELRDQLFHKLKQMYSNQCMAVNGMAQGDLGILKKSGFELARTASTPALASPPKHVSCKEGLEPWYVKVRFTCVPTRQYYEVHVTDAAGKNHYYTCRNTTLIITNLAPSQEIMVRVRAFNSKGAGNYSNSISYYIPRGVSKSRTPQAA
jgi:hypothetical protein